MVMAMTMRKFLEDQQVPFEELRHPRAVTSSMIAEQAHIPGDRLAKAVLIKSDSGYRVALVPGSRKAGLIDLSHWLHERLGLASEDEVAQCFDDCDPGALPALGQAYGLPVCYDDALAEQPEIYFEAGDHETLVHISGSSFRKLMGDAEHGCFSHRL